MGIVFTPEQREVIEARGRNVLVSAAAGSGKTAVLVERIVDKISDREHPVDIDRLLIVTFTGAAAAQMRERIGAAITGRLLAEPENTHLQKQATLIHNAQITTIDSFCLFVIRNNFNDIGLDPGFRVADEGELKLLRQDVMNGLLEECYAQGRKEFLQCVEYFSTGSRDREIEEYILRLHQFAQSCPWPEEWLLERKKDYAVHSLEELEQAPWMEFLLAQVRRSASDCADRLSACLALCDRPDGPYMYAQTLEKEKEALEKLATMSSYEGGYERFHAVAFGRLPSKKDDSVSPLLRKAAQDIRKEVKGVLSRLGSRYFPALPETVARYMEGSAQAVEELIELVLAFGRKLSAKKREENIIDFGDMEHLALSILVQKTEEEYEPTRTALDYRAYFDEILIDEYQDSNLVQEYLLKSISGEPEGRYNRFMVGDVKQSIYRFRLARPEIFMEKYAAYQVGDKDCQRIDLHRNFRSRKEVVDSVNYLFERIMRMEVGGVAYGEEAFLRSGARYPGAEAENRTELLLIPAKEETEENCAEAGAAGDTAAKGAESGGRMAGDPTAESAAAGSAAAGGGEAAGPQGKKRPARQREAYAVAKRIRELVGRFPVTDPDTGLLRPASYGDIVILLRTTSGWDEEFRAVFKEEGIPAHAAARTGYFAASEVRTLLQLLRVLDNPRQDIPLFGVMRSFFGGFDDSGIAALRAGEEDRDRSLYVCLEEAAGKGDQKAQAFLSFVEGWRDRTVYLPIHELLREILTQTGYLNYVTALPGGGQRRANVEMLLEKAAAFEKTSYYGLFHFVRYIEQLEKYDVDYGEANILDENADLVRIMSIHKSKGLEFPICFVCGLSKRFNRQDGNGKMVADVDLGIGVDFVDLKERIRGRTLRRNVIVEKMRQDSMGEELRILYVALTRAKEKLILTGTMDFSEGEGETAAVSGARAALLTRARLRKETALSCTDLLEASCCLDLILAALCDHPAFDAWQGENILPGKAAALQREKSSLRKENTSPSGENVSLDENGTLHDGRTQDLPSFVIRRVTKEDWTGQEIREQLYAEGAKRRLLLSDAVTDTDHELMTYMSEKFSTPYEHANLSELYTKTTVSELKKAGQEEDTEEPLRLYEEEEVIPYIPRFMRTEESLGGAGRGSAFHKVLELLDFGAVCGDAPGGQEGSLVRSLPSDITDEDRDGLHTEPSAQEALTERVRRQITALLKEGRLEAEYARAVEPERIAGFMTTSLAGRMAAADQKGLLHREQPFVLGLSAAELNAKFPPGETVLIQGIIDVYFEEDGELVVADYKTDRVKTPQELVKKYEKQLDYYARALEQLTGKRVKEKVIYSFGLHKEIMV